MRVCGVAVRHTSLWRELIHFLLYELPSSSITPDTVDEEAGNTAERHLESSSATLISSSLLNHGEGFSASANGGAQGSSRFHESSNDFIASFDHLNALEVAAVSDAKKFLSQRVVQRVIEKIWRGDIIFWESLDVNAEKVVSRSIRVLSVFELICRSVALNLLRRIKEACSLDSPDVCSCLLPMHSKASISC